MKRTRREKPKNIVGPRVLQARQRLSLQISQVGLSSCLVQAGVAINRTAVSRIESGDRYVMDYELAALAKCLRVSTAWLLGEVRSYGRYRSARQPK